MLDRVSMNKHLALHTNQRPVIEEQLQDLPRVRSPGRWYAGFDERLIQRGCCQRGLLVSLGDLIA
jgi:hypothetical protein